MTSADSYFSTNHARLDHPGLLPDGHGGYSVEAMAEAVKQLLRDLRISRPHIVGYSLGARVALALALRTSAQLLAHFMPRP